ncbi:putative cyclin-D6-1 [Acorus gramineus]|uniref:Cyclin-D6-1 n=1 Tax=Acorus gramineus TaxID=55184 RepID=A0AAV9A9K0_ACOGR|nr:putative cyclin-D6-1 [Acorus gramineus]
MDFDLENPLTSYDERRPDSFSSLFVAESEQSLFDSRDFSPSMRQDAVALIFQFALDIDPFVPYLAVNYLDRFLARQPVQGEKPWMVRLLSISCLSLASKMMKIDFSIADFQREEGFIFDAQTIRRMELLILGALEWRMRSVTPFCFLSFFLTFFSPNDPPLIASLKARASEILFKAQTGSKCDETEHQLMMYKPSIIAATALLSASHELFPIQFPSFRDAISSCVYVNKEKLLMCWNLIQVLVMDGCDSAFVMDRSTDTPATVLDRHCSSSESEKTDGRDSKKRRIDDYRGDTFHLPQLIQS